MPEAIATSGFTQQDFDAFVDARSEPGWMADIRRAAWDVFQSTPFPSRRDEEWMRTDLRLFDLDRFALPQPSADQPRAPQGVLDTDVELGGRTVALDSQPLHAELKTQWAEQGVVFTNLHEAACEHGDLVKRYLMTGAPAPSYDKFAALHTACFAGGTFLYVPPGVCVDQPLHALSALSDGGVDLGHLLIVVDDDAEATVLSETVSTSQEAAGLHCGGIEILLAPRARLRYVNLQNWSPRVWHFAHQNAALGSQAALQWTIGALGGRLAKVNQHVMLKGEHARAQVNGVMFAEQKQHLAYHTLQHHEAAACHSDLLYKGALQDRATILWRGMIKVDPDAQQTDAYQRDDNLVLSDAARADSIPGLEIEADDVRCSHGATVGRVDDDEIFYALTRGFTRNEAVRMIVAGFFQQVFDRISIESVRDSLGRAIGERIREYA